LTKGKTILAILYPKMCPGRFRSPCYSLNVVCNDWVGCRDCWCCKATTGFSQEVVRRWAFSYFTALAQYPGLLNDLDLDFIQTELSSEWGKACGNPDAILHYEELQLSARKYIRSNEYRKGAPNLTIEMFCKWVNDSFSVDISIETTRRWLHYLGFNMNDHRKGFFFSTVMIEKTW
jgi:hypothetical protein